MSDHLTPTELLERRTRRRTQPVLSNIAGLERWWAPQASTGSEDTFSETEQHSWFQRFFLKAQRFFGGPMPRRMIVTASIIMPVVMIGRLEKVRTQVRQSAPVCALLGQPASMKPTLQEQADQLWKNLALNPEDVSSLRQLAQTLIEQRDLGAARRCFHELEKRNATSDADRALHAELLCTLQDFTGAQAVLSRATGDKSSKLIQEAWLKVVSTSGDMAAALDLMSQMNAAQTLTAEQGLTAAEELFRKPAPAASHLSLERHLLKCLQQSSTEELLEQAKRIIALPWVSEDLRPQVATMLSSLPDSPIDYKLAAVRMRFPTHLDTLQHHELVGTWSQQIRQSGGLSAKDKANAARYFQEQQEHELVAQLIAGQESLTEPALYQLRMKSLLEIGDWREIGHLSHQSGYSALLYGPVISAALAELQSPQVERNSVERLLSNAMQEGRLMQHSAGCFTIGVAALELQHMALAFQAFAYSIEFSTDRRHTLNSVMTHARRHGLSVKELLATVKRTCIFHDDAKDESLSYLSLLAQQDLHYTTEAIQQKRQLYPNDVYLRFLEALTKHQQGNYSEAASLLVPLPKYRWHQGEAAVIAAIMASAGQLERSTALLSQVDERHIFAEERELIEPWKFRLTLQNPLAKVEGE
jgi:thioredoxin-like negative regulator of GroEL